jgi:hypothetical protein
MLPPRPGDARFQLCASRVAARQVAGRQCAEQVGEGFAGIAGEPDRLIVPADFLRVDVDMGNRCVAGQQRPPVRAVLVAAGADQAEGRQVVPRNKA